MASKVGKSAKISVTTIFSRAGKLVSEATESEQIELPLFEADAPIVTVSSDTSITKNLGNYNSVKVGVFCSVPCYLDEDEMQRAYAFCKNFVDARLEERMQEVKAGDK